MSETDTQADAPRAAKLARFRHVWAMAGAAALEARQLMAELEAAGMTKTALADETGLSRTAVTRHINAYRQHTPRRIFGGVPDGDQRDEAEQQ